METVLENNRFGGFLDRESREKWLHHRWKLFANHRFYVSDILSSLSNTHRKKMAILGAGACLDINLRTLLNHYEHISLIDIDGEFLDYTTKIQPNIDPNQVEFIGEIDLVGIHKILQNWNQNPPDEKKIEQLISQISNYQLPYIIGQYDIVSSNCLLSQIIMQIATTLGSDHQSVLPIIQLVRNRHIETMLTHTKVGGCAVLFSDMVSSATTPWLKNVQEDQLDSMLNILIETKNFFTGCNPYAIIKNISEAEHIAANNIKNISLTQPWLWQIEEQKTHLTYALIIEKH